MLFFSVSIFHNTISINARVPYPLIYEETTFFLASSTLRYFCRGRNSDDANFPPLLLDTWPAFVPPGSEEAAAFTFPMRRDMCLLALDCLRSYHVAQSDPIQGDRKTNWQFCLLKYKWQHQNVGGNSGGLQPDHKVT